MFHRVPNFWKRMPPLSDDYAGFVLMNLFDLFLTVRIFNHGGEEVNPVGVWVLERGGFTAFAFFKFGLVALVIVTAEAIYRRQPDRARRLIHAANLVYLGVILWECVLLLFH